jgi:hypothetical protein
MATQEYWPPATGHIEHISAIGRAMVIARKQTAIQLYIITGGPPALTPTMNTPLSAVQLYNRQSTKFRIKDPFSDAPGDNAETKSDHAQQTKGPLEL